MAAVAYASRGFERDRRDGKRDSKRDDRHREDRRKDRGEHDSPDRHDN